MNKVAVQTICGQNDEPFLPYAIQSVHWADYFTVCNTAPDHPIGKENEYMIKELCKDKLRYSELQPDKDGFFSFAEARNKCIDMTDDGDLILIVDSDDIHYPEFEDVVRECIEAGCDSITAYFYHLMVYQNIYQYTQPREIVYKKYPTTQFINGVHEQLITERHWPITVDYWYMHYGYIKSQTEIFKRWKFYSDLEGDFNHYSGQDPSHIVDDRISVSKPIERDHPRVVQDFLYKNYPSYESPKPNIERVPTEKVGLILLTYNDADTIGECITTLNQTQRYPDYEILLIDNNSEDNTVEIASGALSKSDNIIKANGYTTLAEALNQGLDFFRVRHDIQYIGWIHPDMRFTHPNWLYFLWKELQEHPKIGKICAANSRDPIPEGLIEGHEQCYIVRKDIINKVGLFDEHYRGIGGFEDWDLNRRIINHDSYKIMITPRSLVYHEGMHTRSKRDTTPEQVYNARYYQQKWGTDQAAV